MFSKNLKSLRMSKGLSKKDLADILGVTQQYIGQCENEVREPGIKMLKNLSSYFGVSLDELLSDQSDESPNVQKIRELIQKLNYTTQEFAADIGEPYKELDKIILYNTEPTKKIINSICEKYDIDPSEFILDTDRIRESFCNAKENNEYIDLAMFIKESKYDTEYIRNLINLASHLNKSKG